MTSTLAGARPSVWEESEVPALLTDNQALVQEISTTLPGNRAMKFVRMTGVPQST